VCGYQAPPGFADANRTAYTRAGGWSPHQEARGLLHNAETTLQKYLQQVGPLKSDLNETVSAERTHNDVYVAAR
jgi:hypothetical protein